MRRRRRRVVAGHEVAPLDKAPLAVLEVEEGAVVARREQVGMAVQRAMMPWSPLSDDSSAADRACFGLEAREGEDEILAASPLSVRAD
jgi:hypothetical protein